nr:unnamed protein product [Leishmania braziliensis]
MVDQMSGFIQVLTERPALVKQWPLHLKRNTPLDMDTVLAMPTKRASTKRFLQRIQCFLDPSFYDGLRTSRTIKKCVLTTAEIQQAVEMGKFEPCPISDIGAQVQLPEGMHGVNVFTVPELKGRRRLITEPLLNRVIPNITSRASTTTRASEDDSGCDTPVTCYRSTSKLITTLSRSRRHSVTSSFFEPGMTGDTTAFVLSRPARDGALPSARR